ncbi:MAG: gfo/Idh/MocA family oxidoreductase, partial [Flaviramulus sp.]|nr:gfo/Idh/MocA family oxidoreductase [Flaviramulus sp.]
SCDIIFKYDNNISAKLKASLLEDLPCEAIFNCEKAFIKINRMFHSPSTVSIIIDGKEDIIEFNYNTNGYNYEIEHVNMLLRERKTESDIMSFKFSENLILTLDKVRALIGLQYN